MNYTQSFPSLAAFAAYLDKQETTPQYKDEASSLREEKPNSFRTTKNFADAQTLMINGDTECAKKVEKATAEKIRVLNTSTRRTITQDVAGYRPNVGAFLAGKPKSMWRKQTTHTPKPVVTIYYLNGMPGYVTADDAVITSAKLLASIIQIERTQGVKVNLYVCWGAYQSNSEDTATIAVKVKDSNQPFNITRLAYAMVNQDFCRRQCFRYLETCGCSYFYGHGCPPKGDKAKTMFKGHKYDRLITFLDIHGKQQDEITKMLES